MPQEAACFGKPSGSFAFFSRDGSCWRTLPLFSVAAGENGSVPFSGRWPKAGTMRSGVLYGLRTLGITTGGSGCSFWRSPSTPNGRGSQTPEKVAAGGHTLHLEDMAENWPTAGANDWNGTAKPGQRLGQLDEAAEQNWPTPRGEDSESAGNHPGASDSLTGATREWATPDKRCDHAQGASHNPKAQSTQLALQSKEWAMPRSGLPASRKPGTGGAVLEEQSREWRQGQETEKPGPQSSPAGRGSRPRLNPAFCEWLMNFPFLWTDIDASA